MKRGRERYTAARMSLDLAQNDSPELTSVEQCIDWIREGERKPQGFLLGLEHEKFLYPTGGSAPVPYEGPSGVGALLDALTPQGYTPFREAPDRPVIALARDKATISLEPGGQFELSGSPFQTAREAHAENLRHLREVRDTAAGLGLSLVTLGYRPTLTHRDIPWMPKSRYGAMREQLPIRGGRALDMMLMTCTGQVSLDWSDEADCVRKTVLSARVSPLLLALFANSPLQEGRPAGLMSVRSRVWDAVDPTRCGYLPSFFDGSFSYRAYVEWALAAPMLFLRRDGAYLDPAMTFGDLLKKGYQGSPATVSDWQDHLSTLFPEVRLKRVMEIRAADAVGGELTGALPALMRGLLYAPSALDEAEQLLPKLTYAEHQRFHREAQEKGLGGQLDRAPIAELARELVEIAHRGLLAIDPADAPLLEPLRAVAASGRSPAMDVLDAWHADPRPEALLARFSVR